MHSQPTAVLLRGLIEATTLEEAADVVLKPVLGALRRGLEGAQVDGPRRVLRAMVHLRPQRGYSGLVVLEEGSERATAWSGEAAGRSTPAPSATAWQWVLAHEAPLAVDVEAQRFSTWAGGEVPREGTPEPDRWAGRSRVLLQKRQCTHLLAIPLRTARHRVVGLLSVEVFAPLAVGLPFPVWREVGEELSMLADLAAPYLVALPPAPSTAPLTDSLLPVVGLRMDPIVRLLRTFAIFDETVLIRGATGTGKTHLAEWVHTHSSRKAGPFVVANLHTVNENLREGELFGWVKGAFTGAVRDHKGWVGRADGGSLFVDEVDKLDLAAQGKLLRILEERRYTVLGEDRDRRADVRFIIGTNADLERAVADGRFLRDLFYRINVLPVEIPTLADRTDEVGPWAETFLRQMHGRRVGNERVQLSASAEALLRAKDWPGNLRQLYSVMLRAYAFASVGDHGEFPEQVTVGPSHIERAMAMDGAVDATPLVGGLQRAAEAFVNEAERRSEAGEPPIDLELADAFRGFVLSTAKQRVGDERDVFRLFGLEHRLKGGNHLKTYRREIARVHELCATFRLDVPEGMD